VDFSNIQTFLRIVETGSFAKAAEELQYAPSTVTAHIQALEQEFGCALFERIGRKNYLTDIGAEFLDHAREMQYIYQKASAMGKQSEDSNITLRIGGLESLMFNTLLDVVIIFKQKYKNIRINLKIGEAYDLKEMLRQNDLDLIFITDIINTDPSFECHYQREEKMLFLAGPEHELVDQKCVSLQEVLTYPFVVPAPTGNCYNTLRQLAAKSGGEIKDTVMINNIGAISVFLQDNKSISFLYSSAVNQNLNTGNFKIIDVDIPKQVSYSQVLVRKNKWMSPALNHLVSIIEQIHPRNGISSYPLSD